MSAGTVVPCGWYLGLPGDKFEIDLAAELYTLPTVGPLYGSYRVQIDAFITPIRLYSRSLMINRTDIGLNMNMVKLPQLKVEGLNPRTTTGLSFDNYQINPSSILSYYGIRGVGHAPEGTANNNVLVRRFTGLKDLMYWDTIYSYYSNKQEEKAYVIHNNLVQNDVGTVVGANINTPSASDNYALTENGDVTSPGIPVLLRADSKLTVQFASITDLNPESIYIQVHTINTPYFWKATDVFSTWAISGANIVFSNPTIDVS